MVPSSFRLAMRFQVVSIAGVFLAQFASSQPARAAAAYVRVNQVGYETGKSPFRAYLMSMETESGASFKVVGSNGATAHSGRVGALLGTWSHSKTLTYDVYALDFNVPGGDLYTISVTGPAPATSPRFAVDGPDALYSGLLLNTLFFYETERDGGDFVANLTLALESLVRCRAASRRGLMILILFLACWFVVVNYIFRINMSDGIQVFLFVSLPGFMAFLFAYIHVWKAVVFKS